MRQKKQESLELLPEYRPKFESLELLPKHRASFINCGHYIIINKHKQFYAIEIETERKRQRHRLRRDY